MPGSINLGVETVDRAIAGLVTAGGGIETMAAKLNLEPGTFYTEGEILERCRGLFSNRELRRARDKAEIEYYALDKGPRYDRDQILAYMNRRLKKCPEADQAEKPSNTADTGSEPRPAATPSTDIGTSSEDERSAAAHLALVIGKRPSER